MAFIPINLHKYNPCEPPTKYCNMKKYKFRVVKPILYRMASCHRL